MSVSKPASESINQSINQSMSNSLATSYIKSSIVKTRLCSVMIHIHINTSIIVYKTLTKRNEIGLT